MKYLLELQPKWYKSDRDTKLGDCVLFRKREGRLDGPWQMGLVDDFIRSRDGIIRRVIIKYHNASEDCSRTTDRAIRSIVKLFNVDEGSWRQDMDKVQKLLGHSVPVDVEETSANSIHSHAINDPSVPHLSAASTLSHLGESVSLDTCVLPLNTCRNSHGKLSCGRCGSATHQLSLHAAHAHQKPEMLKIEGCCLHVDTDIDEEIKPYLDVVSDQGMCYLQDDPFLSHMLSLQTDFDL